MTPEGRNHVVPNNDPTAEEYERFLTGLFSWLFDGKDRHA